MYNLKRFKIITNIVTKNKQTIIKKNNRIQIQINHPYQRLELFLQCSLFINVKHRRSSDY